MYQEKLARCHEHGLAYDPSTNQGCVLCRRTREPIQAVRSSRFSLRWIVGLGLAAIVLGFVSCRVSRLNAPDSRLNEAQVREDRSDKERSLPAVFEKLDRRNSAGRSGSFYLPEQAIGHRAPVLVLIHPTGGSGDAIVTDFMQAAIRDRLVLIGPDSRVSPAGEFTWQVGDTPGEITADLLHIQGCLAEVLEQYGERMDLNRVLIAGHSGGASSAPYVATRLEPFSAFAVLHGGVFPGGFGRRAVRGWFSTGRGDQVRTPTMVRRAAADAAAKGLGDIVYREFPGRHSISEEERSALLLWWLGGR